MSSVSEEAPYKTVEIHPLANLRGLETVQVLTAAPGSAPAQANSVSAALPPEQSSEAATGTNAGQLASTGSGG